MSAARKSEPRVKIAPPALQIDTRAEVPELGASIEDIRYLATEALSALGVNLRADGGWPTVETIYGHALTELSVEIGLLSDELEKTNDPIAIPLRRWRDRIGLLQCASILAKVRASDRRKAVE